MNPISGKEWLVIGVITLALVSVAGLCRANDIEIISTATEDGFTCAWDKGVEVEKIIIVMNGHEQLVYISPAKKKMEIKKLLRDTWRLRGDNFYDNYYNWLSNHWSEIKEIMEGN